MALQIRPFRKLVLLRTLPAGGHPHSVFSISLLPFASLMEFHLGDSFLRNTIGSLMSIRLNPETDYIGAALGVPAFQHIKIMCDRADVLSVGDR